MLTEIIPINDINESILIEIKQHYDNISFNNYGNPITNKIKSRSTQFNIVRGNLLESYVICGEWNDDTKSADIYSIYPIIANNQ